MNHRLVGTLGIIIFSIVLVTTNHAQVIQRKATPTTIGKQPRLVVSDISLRPMPNDEGFKIFFAYKNIGEGGLPRASEMSVKPNYRVLIDNREVQHGQLFFPDAPTPPGWGIPQNVGFFAGDIKYQSDDHWRVGNRLTVVINEDKALGSESHLMTVNLRQMALQFWYDVIIGSYKLNKSDHKFYVEVRIDGQMGLLKEFELWVRTATNSDDGGFDTVVKIKPGQRVYQFNKKIGFTHTVVTTALDGWAYEKKHEINEFTQLQIIVRPGYDLKTGKIKCFWKDIDHTNDHVLLNLRHGKDY